MGSIIVSFTAEVRFSGFGVVKTRIALVRRSPPLAANAMIDAVRSVLASASKALWLVCSAAPHGASGVRQISSAWLFFERV